MTQLDAALEYVQRGWPVFPLHGIVRGRCTCTKPCGRDAGKHPRTANGFKDASTDPTIIRRWWGQYPDANIGVTTGAESRIWALDIDAAKGGAETLTDLERTHGTLPDTVTALTGGGGRHLVFAHPGQHVVTRTGIAPGIDVRGDGGYFVAPPSLHLSERRYVWAIGYNPNDLPIASAPTWLLSLVTVPSTGTRLQPDAASLHIRAGDRNDRLMRLGGALRRYGVGATAIAECLAAINAYHCDPPLEAVEVKRIAASVARYAPAAAEQHRTVRVG